MRVRDLVPQLPYLVELPERGPGAAMIGRTAALLADLPTELLRDGWTLTDHPGRDLARAQALWRESCDVLAETFDGYTGPLKVQVTGPWTLCAELRWRGDRVLADAGACRDVVQSLAQAVADHAADVRRLVPGAEVVVQVDEPMLPVVLAGGLRTASGFETIRAVDQERALAGLAAVARGHVVHCCAPDVPMLLLRRAGAAAVALDMTLLDARAWESVAETVEAGTRVWLGVPAGGRADTAGVGGVVQGVLGPWRRVGLPVRALADQVVTPACGLAGAGSVAAAASAHEVCALVAQELEEVTHG